MLRLTQDLLLLLSISLSPEGGTGTQVARLFKCRLPNAASRALEKNCLGDWQMLVSALNLHDMRLSLFIHIILRNHAGLHSDPVFQTKAARNAFEKKFDAELDDIIHVRKTLQKHMEELGTSGRLNFFRKCLGDDLWDTVMDLNQSSVYQQIWSHRPPATLVHFQDTFHGSVGHQTAYGFLRAFLLEEERLPRIK